MDLRSLRSCAKIAPGQQQLTAEQRASARLFAELYAQTLLSCVSIDETEAEEHIRQAYRVVGLQEPSIIRWFDSPLAFVLAYAAAAKENEQEVYLGSIFDEIGPNRIETSLLLEVEDTLEMELWDFVGVPLRDSVWESMTTRLENSVLRRAWNSAWNSVRSYLAATGSACDLFFHEVFEANSRIHLARLNTMVLGDWLGSREAWLVRKPIHLERDEQGRLHADSGPCVQFADGWGVSAWHGRRPSENHPTEWA